MGKVGKPTGSPGKLERAAFPQYELTKRAGQLGESERLAAAGHQRADFALSAAHAILFKRAKSPQYWPFSPSRVNTPSTGGAEELEVEGSGSANVPKFEAFPMREGVDQLEFVGF